MYLDHDVEMGSVDDDGAGEWEDNSNDEGLTTFLLGRKGFYRVMLVEKPSSTRSLRIVNQSMLIYLFFAADCNIGQKTE